MVKCPACGQEIEAFIKKPRAKHVICPACKKKFKTSEVPAENVKVVDKYPWEELEESEEEEVETLVTERGEPEKAERVYELFEAPKEIPEIVAEILSEHGCAEQFIKMVTRYIERKGYLDGQWLFNMLLRARTGRRFTEEEAFLVVDEIMSAVEAERRKYESAGKPFRFTIIPLTTTTPTPAYTTTYTPAYTPTHPTQPPPTYLAQQPYTPPPPSTTTPVQTARDDIVRIIREEFTRLLTEKRASDEIAELKRKVTEEIPKQVEEKLEKQRTELLNIIKESIAELKNIVSSIQTRPAVSEEEITKKDLELMRERIEKELVARVQEAERKVLEERLKAIEAKLEEKKQPIIPPPSEGYKEDSFRLIADTIKTLVRPGEWWPGRAVTEVLVRLVPTHPPPERKELPSEKSIVEKMKEAGGLVE